jgi:hypothetical protein
MKTIYNVCVCCKAKWQVIGPKSDLTMDDIKLDSIDLSNLEKHGKLFSVCEDCSDHGTCESVEV